MSRPGGRVKNDTPIGYNPFVKLSQTKTVFITKIKAMLCLGRIFLLKYTYGAQAFVFTKCGYGIFPLVDMQSQAPTLKIANTQRDRI